MTARHFAAAIQRRINSARTSLEHLHRLACETATEMLDPAIESAMGEIAALEYLSALLVNMIHDGGGEPIPRLRAEAEALSGSTDRLIDRDLTDTACPATQHSRNGYVAACVWVERGCVSYTDGGYLVSTVKTWEGPPREVACLTQAEAQDLRGAEGTIISVRQHPARCPCNACAAVNLGVRAGESQRYCPICAAPLYYVQGAADRSVERTCRDCGTQWTPGREVKPFAVI